MTSKIINQEYYNSYQPNFLLDFSISSDEIESDSVMYDVIGITERIDFTKYVDISDPSTRAYNALRMFQSVLLGYTLDGYCSTRDLESYCKNDIRFRYIMSNEKPSHMTFQNFIHDKLTMPIDDIFIDINKIIEKDMDINVSILYIDGSKFEANANKMTFVWAKATKRYYRNTWKKMIKLIERINRYFEEHDINVRYSVLKEASLEYAMEIAEKIENYMDINHIKPVHGRGTKRTEIQKIHEELKDIALNLYKYTMHFDILGDRNSFSKTDPDATFMHMKYDYYNHTGVFKPGYNVQLGTSDGFIRNIYVSADQSDTKTYIPFMEKYKAAYGNYPLATPADAGYGGYDNYTFAEANGIDLLMKYPGMNVEKEKLNEKNQFKSYKMIQEDGRIICPNNHEFKIIGERTEKRGIYDRQIVMYENEQCKNCPLKSKCTKAKGNRQVHLSPEYERQKKIVRNNVETEYGKLLMKNRSIYAEGTFGCIKEDNGYTRLRRRGISGVKLELTLVAIGHNIRKYNVMRLKKESETEVIN